MKVYHLWKSSYTGMRFVDTWGISHDELAAVSGVELVIGPSCFGCFSGMFQVNRQKLVVDTLDGMGAVSLDTIQKESLHETSI